MIVVESTDAERKGERECGCNRLRGRRAGLNLGDQLWRSQAWCGLDVNGNDHKWRVGQNLTFRSDVPYLRTYLGT